MSDQYSHNVVADANAVLKRLLLKGALPRTDALYQKYVGSGQQDVRALVDTLARDHWGAVVIDVADGLFCFPAPGNTEIGLTVDLLRQRLGVRLGSASELNLCLFVMMAVLALLQGDSGGRLDRMYVTEQELIGFVDSKLGALSGLEDTPALEAEYALDLRGMAARWNEMQTADPRDPERTRQHRQGFCRKVLRLWEEEDLLQLEGDGRIFPRPRLQAAFSRFYTDRDRIRHLLRMLKSVGEVSHADA